MPGFAFNLSCLFPDKTDVEDLTLSATDNQSIENARAELRRGSRLDPSQADAVVDALTREVSLIQGPQHAMNTADRGLETSSSRTGRGLGVFAQRFNSKTGEKTDFVRNKSPYDQAKILICTGKIFGCGSSREHAAWALNDFGIRCVIAPSLTVGGGCTASPLSLTSSRDSLVKSERALRTLNASTNFWRHLGVVPAVLSSFRSLNISANFWHHLGVVPAVLSSLCVVSASLRVVPASIRSPSPSIESPPLSVESSPPSSPSPLRPPSVLCAQANNKADREQNQYARAIGHQDDGHTLSCGPILSALSAFVGCEIAGAGNGPGNNNILSSPSNSMSGRFDNDFPTEVPRPSDETCASSSAFTELIAKLLKITEPTAVEARRRGRLKRRHFWCAGVNDVWPQDQHDKWLRFGLWLHISLDPFTGWINWLKVWWTNKNPRLIARYYLDCCRKLRERVHNKPSPFKLPAEVQPLETTPSSSNPTSADSTDIDGDNGEPP
ncbi:aconitase C-terminal domain-containing protein [Suillus variegatus]|nr:aconitase C-terminal domain-containing protein [Suillus variegatus]